MVSIKPADSALANADLSGATLTVTGDKSTNVVNLDGSAEVTVALSGVTVNVGKSACIELIDANDKTVATWWGEGNGSASSWQVTLPDNIAAGIYTVEVSTTTNAKEASLVVVDPEANRFWDGYTVTPSTEQRAFDETGKAVDFGVKQVTDLEKNPTSDYVVKYYVANATYANQGALDAASEEDLAAFFADGDNLVEGTGEAPSEADQGYGYSAGGHGGFIMAVFPADSELAGVTVPQAFYFDIYDTAAAQKTLSLYDKTSGNDLSDTTFVYGNANYMDGTDTGDTALDNLGLIVDGEEVSLYGNGLNSKTGKYYVSSVDYKTPDGTTLSAGSHTIGIGYSGTDNIAYLNIVVEQFDISKASVSVKDTAAAAANGSSNTTVEVVFSYDGATLTKQFANGKVSNDPDFSLAVDSYSPAVGSGAVSGYKGFFAYAGTYGFSVSYNGDDDANIVMSGAAAKGEVRILKNGVNAESTFSYTGDNNSGSNVSFGGNNAGAVVVIDKSAKQEFDAESIKWGTGTAYDPELKNAEITITDAETGEVVSDCNAAGLYKVEVKLATGVLYDNGGSSYFYVNVVNGLATDANIYITVDGKPASSGAEVAYDGQAVPFTTLVKLADEAGTVLKEGTDYTVKVEKQNAADASKWTAVSEIKDPGTYRIVVESSDYKVTQRTDFTVVVSPTEFDGIEAVAPTYGYSTDYAKPGDASETPLSGQDAGYAYTGSAVTPTLKLYVTDSEGEKVYFDLPAECYKATYKLDGKVVAASDVVNVDEYTVDVTIDEEALAAVYGEDAALTGGKTAVNGIAFEIVDAISGGFSDVKASAWYADEATKAKQLGYMTGLQDTNMLLPEASITRADVAVVLFRMAGGKDDPAGSTATYPTKFADVAEDAYYAKAIDWAYKAGIITGYDGTDSFGPNDMVTREQLATMLGRFAEKVQGKDVSAGAIEGYTDADAVSDFAVEGMSWCVENGVFGVNTTTLDPQGDATRAQVAAIAVRVAPAVEIKA